MQEAIIEMTAKRLGCVGIVDGDGRAGRASSPTAICAATSPRPIC